MRLCLFLIRSPGQGEGGLVDGRKEGRKEKRRRAPSRLRKRSTVISTSSKISALRVLEPAIISQLGCGKYPFAVVLPRPFWKPGFSFQGSSFSLGSIGAAAKRGH